MNVLWKLLSFAAETLPDVLPVLEKLVKDFCDCEGIDLGPPPPDWDRFKAVDAKIDKELLERK